MQKPWRIFMLDDDEDDYFLTLSMLKETSGVKTELEWSSSYDVALEKVKTNLYDAVLVDYDLGIRTGIDFIQEINTLGGQLPIILFTGRGSYDVDLEAMQAGATLYLTKNEANPLLLERAIRYAIELKQKELQLRKATHQLEQELVERRQAEKAMVEAKSMLEAITESTDNILIAALDKNFQYSAANQAYKNEFKRIFGEEVQVGSNLIEALAHLPEEQKNATDLWQRALNGETVDVIAEFGDPSRDRRFFDLRFYPIRDEHGNVIGAGEIATDVTERVWAEQALRRRESDLRESEERYRTLFAGMKDGFALGEAIFDEQGNPTNFKFLMVNDSFEEQTGLSPKIVGIPITEVLPNLEPSWIDTYCGVATSGEPVSFVRYNQDTGRHYDVFCFQPAPNRFGILFRDVTEYKHTEEQIKTYAERLERSNQELERFAMVASHDLQDPLRKIRMFGSRLKQELNGNLPGEAKHYLNRIQGAAEQMQAMIDSLLELSRVNTRGGNFEPADLTTIAEEVIADLEPRIRQSEGTVHIEPLPTAEVDPLQIRQLFQNLIGNALKFHKPDVPPEVRVSASVQRIDARQMVTINITDNGIGFDEEQASKIFQPFQRLHNANEYEGTGMGLAICQRIVERHHGFIEVESQPGEGSTFRVVLPLKQAS
jgi:PAS domain S-box-containing protein